MQQRSIAHENIVVPIDEIIKNRQKVPVNELTCVTFVSYKLS